MGAMYGSAYHTTYMYGQVRDLSSFSLTITDEAQQTPEQVQWPGSPNDVYPTPSPGSTPSFINSPGGSNSSGSPTFNGTAQPVIDPVLLDMDSTGGRPQSLNTGGFAPGQYAAFPPGAWFIPYVIIDL